jgi:hypothetical protein
MTTQAVTDEIKTLAVVMAATGQGTRALAALATDAGFDWHASLDALERFLSENLMANTGQDELDDSERARIHDAAQVMLGGYLAGRRSLLHDG